MGNRFTLTKLALSCALLCLSACGSGQVGSEAFPRWDYLDQLNATNSSLAQPEIEVIDWNVPRGELALVLHSDFAAYIQHVEVPSDVVLQLIKETDIDVANGRKYNTRYSFVLYPKDPVAGFQADLTCAGSRPRRMCSDCWR